MNMFVKLVLTANLIVLAILAFVYPNLMVGPGKLIPSHSKIETDCFACHAPLTGVSSDRCVICHKVAEIGRLTSTGQPTTKPLTSLPFHHKLITIDCVNCHSDHAGVKRYHKQGRFDHLLLQSEMRNQCQSCHKAPDDTLHNQATGACNQCHSYAGWLPATYDHNKYFELDGDHKVRCDTCHVRNDYKQYTCYGCHEHTPENMRGKHLEEGIRNLDDCVKCHKSASEDNVQGEGGNEGNNSKMRKGKEDND
jgi:hypothetical protein